MLVLMACSRQFEYAHAVHQHVCTLQEGQEVKCFNALAAWIQADAESRAPLFLELFGRHTDISTACSMA